MKVIEYSKNNLAKLIDCDNLILFVGAGFVKGEVNEFGNKLIDGNSLKNYFVDKIVKKDKSISKEELKTAKFSEVSQIFFELFSHDEIKNYFAENFTKVKLGKLKRDFLTKIKWKNIFTLNIDDALENATSYYVIFPDEEYDVEMLSKYSPLIIKLHGDVKRNLINKKDLKENIIFSRLSYIRALMQKNKIYDIFLDNYKDFNTIFIGVSFDDEIELEGFIDNEFRNLSDTLNRIYVTKDEINSLKQIKLKAIGVNKVLKISNYDDFYKDLIEICTKNQKEKDDIIKFFSFDVIRENDKDKNILYLLGEQTINIKDKKIFNPFFNIKRIIYLNINDVTNKKEYSYEEFYKDFSQNNFFLIRGKRFSGKTYFLINVYNDIKFMRKIFIPSEVKLDLEQLKHLLEYENLLIILDTNSYDNRILNYIKAVEEEIILKNIKVIFAVNHEDIIENWFFYWDNIKEYYLENKFTDKELRKLNDKLNLLGIIKFKNKDKNKNKITIIDNLFSVYNKFYKDKRNNSKINKKVNSVVNKFFSLPEEKREIIFTSAIILVIENKLYSSVFYRIFSRVDEFLLLADFFEFFIEKEKIIFEKEQNSGFKYSLECNSCMYYFLREIINRKFLKMDWIVNVVVKAVKMLYNTRHKNLAKKLINFSNLNFLFSYKKTGGARTVIYKIYDNLNELLYNDIDYWLQRAKSILYLASKEDIEMIKNGIDYAKKAYVDAEREKKERQALFTVALLYGRLAHSLKFENELINKEALEWYYSAFIEDKNKRYVDYYLSRDLYKNDLFLLLNNIKRNNLKNELKFKYNYLFNMFQNRNR